MRLSRKFIAFEAGNESMLIPTGSAEFSGLVKGNCTFGAILALLENDVTEEEMIDKMCAEYDAPREQIAGDVRRTISDLRSIGAIED